MVVTRCRVVGEEVVLAGPGHSPSSPNLHGEVLEILGQPGVRLLRVRWENGIETVLPEQIVAVGSLRTADASLFERR